VTEKIDGTNAQILITENGCIKAGSRNRWLTPKDDNYGFCRWMCDNADGLLRLGPGRHYGEWWGLGINRGYGLDEKRFSLFNTMRWADDAAREQSFLPEGMRIPPLCCDVVPVLWAGDFDDMFVDGIMADLVRSGSKAAPGYHAPEGVVIYHSASRTLFKKTFDNDHTGKGEK
jgi:hypothetical protein